MKQNMVWTCKQGQYVYPKTNDNESKPETVKMVLVQTPTKTENEQMCKASPATLKKEFENDKSRISCLEKMSVKKDLPEQEEGTGIWSRSGHQKVVQEEDECCLSCTRGGHGGEKKILLGDS